MKNAQFQSARLCYRSSKLPKDLIGVIAAEGCEFSLETRDGLLNAATVVVPEPRKALRTTSPTKENILIRRVCRPATPRAHLNALGLASEQNWAAPGQAASSGTAGISSGALLAPALVSIVLAVHALFEFKPACRNPIRDLNQLGQPGVAGGKLEFEKYRSA